MYCSRQGGMVASEPRAERSCVSDRCSAPYSFRSFTSSSGQVRGRGISQNFDLSPPLYQPTSLLLLSPSWHPQTAFHFPCMAARSLAFSLRQAGRSRAALNSIQPLRRFATPVSHGSKTESTTLSNGFTVSLAPFCKTLYFADCVLDRHRALSLGANLDGRCLDRCRKQGRNRQDKWHSALS